MSEEQEEEVIRLNPEELKVFGETIDEVKNSMQRIKDEQSYIKDACALMKEKYGIPLPITRKVATFLLSQEKQAKAETEMDLVEYLLESIK